MTAVRCPQGHDSETDDFCDQCGTPIGGPGVPVASVRTAPPETGGATTAPPAAPEVCPWCGTPRTGRFCEEDGYDFVAAGSLPPPEPQAPAAPPQAPAAVPQAPAQSGPSTASSPEAGPVPQTGSPAATATWVLVVEADRRYYDSVRVREGPDIDAVSFPQYYPREEIPLDGTEVRIGRRRAGGASLAPDVDLTGPPLDPGVSHRHAVLLPDGTGGWAVLDPGSMNGTTINYADDPIAVDTRVPLAPGDHVHVGAFTTLTLERR